MLQIAHSASSTQKKTVRNFLVFVRPWSWNKTIYIYIILIYSIFRSVITRWMYQNFSNASNWMKIMSRNQSYICYPIGGTYLLKRNATILYLKLKSDANGCVSVAHTHTRTHTHIFIHICHRMLAARKPVSLVFGINLI